MELRDRGELDRSCALTREIAQRIIDCRFPIRASAAEFVAD
ncbi:hypothetical protein [Streptomyces sp. NBC_01497]|nr:hypothetical protein [Streptomyces sp. NBC_01497]